MFNLLRMDLRRLLRTKSFYIVLAVWAALLLLLVLLVTKISDPRTLDAMQESGVVTVGGDDLEMGEEIRGMTQLEFIYECLGSGFLPVMAGIGTTLFVFGDFSGGCIKNICFAQPRRWQYVCAKALTAGAYSGVMIVLSMALLIVSPGLFGLPLARSSAAELLQYAFWLWLLCWCFVLMPLSLVLLTRGSTMGILLSVLAGIGLIAAMLRAVCRQFGWPEVSQYFVSSVIYDQCVPWLGRNEIGAIVACVAGWGAVYLGAGLAAMRARDL